MLRLWSINGLSWLSNLTLALLARDAPALFATHQNMLRMPATPLMPMLYSILELGVISM